MGALDFTIQQEQIINKLKADQDFLYLMNGPQFKYLRFTDMFEAKGTQIEYKTMPNLTILRVVDHALTDVDFGNILSKLHGREDKPFGPSDLEVIRNVTVAEFALAACIEKLLNKYTKTDIAGYTVLTMPEPTYNNRSFNFRMSNGQNEIRVILEVRNPRAEALQGVKNLSDRILVLTVISQGKRSTLVLQLKDLVDVLENEIKNL